MDQMKGHGLLIAVAVSVAAAFFVSADASGEGRVTVLGVDIGTSTLRETLLALGPGESVYLAGHDSEDSSPSVTDALIVTWKKTIDISGSRDVYVYAAFDKSALTLSSLYLLFDSKARPSDNDLVQQYGAESKLVRRRIVGEEDALDLTLGDCEDPGGNIITRVFPGLGLDAYLEPQGVKVEGLLFSSRRLKQGYPPRCSTE